MASVPDAPVRMRSKQSSNRWRSHSKYVLDADIKGCFDHISHPALLRKLDVPARIRRAIKAWLTAGIMTTEGWTPTTAGTPQGGVVSPLLMNVALHGLQTAVEAAYVRRTRTTNGDEGKAIRPRLLRYADDFVVLCRDLDGITAAQEAAERWLADMGLTLSPTKTRITHTLEPYQGNVGFDFLGCTVRQWPAGKYHATRLKGKVSTGFNVSITPSKSAITRHIADLRATVRKMRTSSQEGLINRLNPQIRGWSRYYRHVGAIEAFTACDQALHAQLRRWSRRRHPNKSAQWIVRRYWRTKQHRRWCFRTAEGLPLAAHTDTKHERYVQVRTAASPYDGNFVYWSTRLRARWTQTSQLARLLRRQRGKCAACGLVFRDEDRLEKHHLVRPDEGGTQLDGNLQVLHVHCHDQLTVHQRAEAGYLRQGPDSRGAV